MYQKADTLTVTHASLFKFAVIHYQRWYTVTPICLIVATIQTEVVLAG